MNPNQLPTCTYLYGLTPEQIKILADTPYSKALQFKVDCAESLNERLHEPDFMNRDTDRINAVLKAIKFNKQLLDEL